MVKSPLREILIPCAMSELQNQWELRKSRILDTLKPEEIQTILNHSVRIVRQRGEIFDFSDVKTPHVYILDKGYIRFSQITEEGQKVVTGFLGPADLFGTILIAQPSDLSVHYIEAVREARVLGVETTVFSEVLQRYPQFMMRLIQVLEEHRQALSARVLSLVSKDMYAQTAETLLVLGLKFGEACTAPEPEHFPDSRDISLTHQELADLVGIARPSLSKVVSEFVKAGYLRKHGNYLCVHDTTTLRLIAESGNKAVHRV